MKLIRYYGALLVFILLFSFFLMEQDLSSMGMEKMVIACLLLGIYIVILSFIGEGRLADEREIHHRYLANRFGLLAGSTVLSFGILYQLFNHELDYWLLASLVAINLVKIISLIYAHYKK